MRLCKNINHYIESGAYLSSLYYLTFHFLISFGRFFKLNGSTEKFAVIFREVKILSVRRQGCLIKMFKLELVFFFGVLLKAVCTMKRNKMSIEMMEEFLRI